MFDLVSSLFDLYLSYFIGLIPSIWEWPWQWFMKPSVRKLRVHHKHYLKLVSDRFI